MKKLVMGIHKKIKNNRLLMLMYGLFRVIIYAVVLAMLAIIIVQNVSHNNLSIGGFRVFTVVSGSMTGEYEIGDILVLKKADAKDIKVGDNVSYYGEARDVKGLVVTHKVIKVLPQENGDTYYITKGLANDVADPQIKYSQIYGKVVYRCVFLSFLARIMMIQRVYYFLFVFIGILVSYEIISAKYRDDEEEDNGEEG